MRRSRILSRFKVILTAWAVSLCVYLATMFPGLAAIGDTPKFQFVGAVLGIPHSPGYPLYVLLSWAFSRIPIATIAFRANLMSAVFGSAAVALAAATLLELGCAPIVAIGVSLAFAFGRLFWSQALLAEVYTLNATLFLAMVLSLLLWRRTKSDKHLVWAALWCGLGTAHHLTLTMTAPGVAAFVLLTDWTVLGRWRTLACIVAVICAALTLYGFIWIRSVQGAPYLEVQARSVGDLVRIVEGRQFTQYLAGAAPLDRIPLVWQWLLAELRPWGIVLALAGIGGLMARRRWSEASLLLMAFAAVVVFTLNYNVYDVEVFLILPIIVLWLSAGVGASELLHLFPIDPRAGLVVLVLPILLFRANVRANNHHAHRFEQEYFNAFFADLPDRTAIVSEGYVFDDVLRYKLIGEGAARGRSIVIIDRRPDVVASYLSDRYLVLAFLEARRELEPQGVQFEMAGTDLPGPHPMRHVLDTEVVKSYGLSRVVGVAAQSR